MAVNNLVVTKLDQLHQENITITVVPSPRYVRPGRYEFDLCSPHKVEASVEVDVLDIHHLIMIEKEITKWLRHPKF